MIAGNVRGLAEEKKDESLLNELSIFSGKVFLVKRYEMAVTK